MKTKEGGFFKILYQWLVVGRKWEIAEDWHFVMSDGIILFMPKGFVFNGASIPRILRGIFSPVGLLFVPSVFHDYAYEHDYLLQVNAKCKIIRYRPGAGRAYWDRLFSKISSQVNGFSIGGKIARIALAVGGQLVWEVHHGSKLKKKIATTALKIIGIINVVVPIMGILYFVKDVICSYL